MNDDDWKTASVAGIPPSCPGSWTCASTPPARPPCAVGRPFWLTVGALATGAALAAGLLLSPAGSFPPGERRSPPVVRSTDDRPAADRGRLVFGENLTMNIATGVQPAFWLAAYRLDRDDPVGGPAEPPFSSRGISLKVNCQF